MFEFLKKFHVVLVTGPQRSGTRIAAHMIAQDTGFMYVDEMEFAAHNVEQFTRIVSQASVPVVIQCPAMCHRIHRHSGADTAVVFMLREVGAIRASEKRVKWDAEERELLKYKRRDGVISEVRYAFWLTHQRRKVLNVFEIYYASLKAHSLWVNERSDFTVAQWM